MSFWVGWWSDVTWPEWTAWWRSAHSDCFSFKCETCSLLKWLVFFGHIHHQNLIIRLLAHCQNFLKMSLKAWITFGVILSTGRQMNACRHMKSLAAVKVSSKYLKKAPSRPHDLKSKRENKLNEIFSVCCYFTTFCQCKLTALALGISFPEMWTQTAL